MTSSSTDPSPERPSEHPSEHRPGRRRGRAPLAMVVALATILVLGACSSSKTPATDDQAGSATSSSTTTTSAPSGGTGSTLSSIPDGTATVDVASTELGQVLVDLSGHTLYIFTADTEGTPTCVDDSCTKVWPPLTGSAIAIGTGVPATSGEFKLVPRPGGPNQLTVHGRPLYTYSGDASPGETNGQGVGGSWFVVGVDGQPVQS